MRMIGICMWLKSSKKKSVKFRSWEVLGLAKGTWKLCVENAPVSF